MANAPIPCPVCGSLHTRVRDTLPVDPADLGDDGYVRLFVALGSVGPVTGQARVQLLECASCPVDGTGRPRLYRLTYLPPTYCETDERYLRMGSTARRDRN